jgi:superfamily II DNA or RNA helicase
VCRWYLLNSPMYGLLLKRVWLWEDWPGRWGRDAGIDLVAETHDGECWAIQAKAYAPTTSVTKADVDSFLSESARDVFSFRLLIATTDRIGHNARQVLGGQSIPASVRLLGDLAAEPIHWPASIYDLSVQARPPSTPRAHQTEALEAIERHLSRGGRGRVVMACGTGKTFVQLWAHERLKSQRTLVLVPSLFLVQQSVQEWTANRSRPFEFLAVCSDETVVDRDSFVSDVTELGLPVTTDPKQIRRFLEGGGDRVIFSTYQSSRQIAMAMRGTELRFDLILADEAHRLAGTVSRDFAAALRDEDISARRRVFFTATPRYLTGKLRGSGAESDLEVASMDDESMFGPEIHRLSFGEAIARELLSDYRVVVVGVSDTEVFRLAEQGALVTFEGKATDARSLAREVGLAKAMHRFALRRVISFHSRVQASRRFSDDLASVIPHLPSHQSPQGRLVFDYVSGEMATGDRRRRINRLRNVAEGEYALLANARCLSEGVDVPSIDGVAFVDPRRSQIDIIQAVGRAIRLSPDKTLGTIVIPVLIPEGSDEEAVLSDSAFEPVWAVVRALRDYDEELAEQLDAARRKLGLERRLTRANLPPKLILDLPTGIVGPTFMDAFTARVVERTTSSWEEGFAQAQAYAAENRDALVPDRFLTADGFQLGKWVGNQRVRRQTLSPDHRKRLEALRGWQWDVNATLWEKAFAHLLAFVQRTGHALVSTSFATADGFKLGLWVSGQRAAYAKGVLTPNRFARLNELKGWEWDAQVAWWEEGFAQLQAFAERERHARVPGTSRTGDGYRLGQWVAVQRVNHGKGVLSPERAKRLEEITGWEWDGRAAWWEEGFAQLQAFAEREGHARVPGTSRTGDGYRLGQWVSNQRAAYARGLLKPERVGRLEAIAGWEWNVRAAAWEEGFAHLLVFVERVGDGRVAVELKADDGYPLGQWARVQRRAVRPGKITEERRRRLDSVPGWSWPTNKELKNPTV